MFKRNKKDKPQEDSDSNEDGLESDSGLNDDSTSESADAPADPDGTEEDADTAQVLEIEYDDDDEGLADYVPPPETADEPEAEPDQEEIPETPRSAVILFSDTAMAQAVSVRLTEDGFDVKSKLSTSDLAGHSNKPSKNLLRCYTDIANDPPGLVVSALEPPDPDSEDAAEKNKEYLDRQVDQMVDLMRFLPEESVAVMGYVGIETLPETAQYFTHGFIHMRSSSGSDASVAAVNSSDPAKFAATLAEILSGQGHYPETDDTAVAWIFPPRTSKPPEEDDNYIDRIKVVEQQEEAPVYFDVTEDPMDETEDTGAVPDFSEMVDIISDTPYDPADDGPQHAVPDFDARMAIAVIGESTESAEYQRTGTSVGGPDPAAAMAARQLGPDEEDPEKSTPGYGEEPAAVIKLSQTTVTEEDLQDVSKMVAQRLLEGKGDSDIEMIADLAAQRAQEKGTEDIAERAASIIAKEGFKDITENLSDEQIESVAAKALSSLSGDELSALAHRLTSLIGQPDPAALSEESVEAIAKRVHTRMNEPQHDDRLFDVEPSPQEDEPDAAMLDEDIPWADEPEDADPETNQPSDEPNEDETFNDVDVATEQSNDGTHEDEAAQSDDEPSDTDPYESSDDDEQPRSEESQDGLEGALQTILEMSEPTEDPSSEDRPEPVDDSPHSPDDALRKEISDLSAKVDALTEIILAQQETAAAMSKEGQANVITALESAAGSMSERMEEALAAAKDARPAPDILSIRDDMSELIADIARSRAASESHSEASAKMLEMIELRMSDILSAVRDTAASRADKQDIASLRSYLAEALGSKDGTNEVLAALDTLHVALSATAAADHRTLMEALDPDDGAAPLDVMESVSSLGSKIDAALSEIASMKEDLESLKSRSATAELDFKVRNFLNSFQALTGQDFESPEET